MENSLELQKGASDTIELKNRIRRLIKMFFPERDCCALVRPVEDEKILRKLQEIDDEEFRPEFTHQMLNLRKKLFKKIKAKSLNSQYVNGEMLLELAL